MARAVQLRSCGILHDVRTHEAGLGEGANRTIETILHTLFHFDGYLFAISLKKPRIDKLLWLCGFRLWHLRCEHLENELDSFDREERLFGNRFYIVVPGSFEDFGIVGAHVLGENFLRCLPVGVDKMDSLEVSLHRRLDSLAIALDVCARASEAV